MKFLIILLLKCYHLISPTLYMLLPSPPHGRCCRFEPSCSVYAREAVERYGVVKGISLAIKRMSRCRPFAKWGHDPIPH